MAKDVTYGPNIYSKDGGNTLVIAGGTVESEDGQAAAIADATNTTDVITQVNAILAALRKLGIVAPNA